MVAAVLLAALVSVGSLFGLAQGALAHGEIIDASPGDREIVGGEITEIAIQFIGIAHPGAHTISVKDPDGVSVIPAGPLEQDLFRLILPIEPLTKPGLHTVTAVVESIDDDTVATSFAFDYQPGAPSPEPIEFEQYESRIDAVTIGLMVMTAMSIVGFVLLIRHRLRITAPAETADVDDADVDDADDEDEDEDEDEDHSTEDAIGAD